MCKNVADKRMKRLFQKKSTIVTAGKPLPPLALCILLDAIGCASYLLPFLGEFIDVIWAPISGIIYYRLFGGVKGLFGGVFSFLEELLPGFDIIPTFTITWFLQQQKRSKDAVTIQSFR